MKNLNESQQLNYGEMFLLCKCKLEVVSFKVKKAYFKTLTCNNHDNTSYL